MAIDLGDIVFMKNLGNYCQEIENDYDEMKKYYLMAIEKNILNSKYLLNLHLSKKINLYK